MKPDGVYLKDNNLLFKFRKSNGYFIFDSGDWALIHKKLAGFDTGWRWVSSDEKGIKAVVPGELWSW